MSIDEDDFDAVNVLLSVRQHEDASICMLKDSSSGYKRLRSEIVETTDRVGDEAKRRPRMDGHPSMSVVSPAAALPHAEFADGESDTETIRSTPLQVRDEASNSAVYRSRLARMVFMMRNWRKLTPSQSDLYAQIALATMSRQEFTVPADGSVSGVGKLGWIRIAGAMNALYRRSGLGRWNFTAGQTADMFRDIKRRYVFNLERVQRLNAEGKTPESPYPRGYTAAEWNDIVRVFDDDFTDLTSGAILPESADIEDPVVNLVAAFEASEAPANSVSSRAISAYEARLLMQKDSEIDKLRKEVATLKIERQTLQRKLNDAHTMLNQVRYPRPHPPAAPHVAPHVVRHVAPHVAPHTWGARGFN